MSWLARAPELEGLSPDARARLSDLPVMTMPKGQTLFCPGEAARGFVLVLSGRVEVYLIGPTGREILLYAVEPGQSCIQSTLGLLGGEDYTGEAITAADCELVLVPRDLFLTLMEGSAPFRQFVFGAFATRMQGIMSLLESVAFQKVESRLAATLLELSRDGTVQATHQDLATRIGTAREVVSRRLDQMARAGQVTLGRGAITLTDTAALRRAAAFSTER